LPPVGSVPPLSSTTNPGRSWFSDPMPYVIQEPIDAFPNRGAPVNRNSSAGAWLNWSVLIERTTVISSAMRAMFGTISLNHPPACPA